MKKKNLLFVAAAMVMAGCASDDMIGDNNATQSDNQVIAFNMNVPATTRADREGKDAASDLGKEFIVWGEKNEKTQEATEVANLVFENYRVQYADDNGSTAGTAPSNTKGWDYVGIAPYSEGVTPKITTETQTIKYWDLGKPYTFTAVSASQANIGTDKNVVIVKTEGSTNLKSEDKGYTITLKKGADASKIFVADRQVITPATKTSTGVTSVDPVTLTFRRFQTKIRFGFFETVPGYDVQITKIGYEDANKADQTSDAKLYVNGNFVTVPTEDSQTVEYKVTYDSSNKPNVTITTSGATASTNVSEFGQNIFNNSTSKKLGKNSTSPLYDIDGGKYTSILPNTGNSTPMTFTVSYKLISEDTKEEILVENRQVTVPAAYCQWKPNFAYTYLFKVSDKSAELYPITFDAVVAEDEVDLQKTITEVSGDTEKVCITTLGIGKDGKFSTDVDEYTAGSTIYASVTADDDEVTLTDATAKLYTVTATKPSGNASATVSVPEAITEAAVANCLNRTATSGSNPSSWTVTDQNNVTMTVTASTLGSIAGSVPAEDGGTARTMSVLKWTDNNTNSESGTYYYVVEYSRTVSVTPTGESTAVQTTKKYYKVVKVVK